MAFSLLNLGSIQEIIKLFADPDVYHFYHHLLFRTIIIQSIIKDTKPEEEDEAGIEEEKAIKAIDREPTSITDTKNPLTAESHDEIKDMSENDDEMMETSDTNEGKTTATFDEEEKFNETLILVSNNPLYCFPHIVWNIKIGINGFGRIDRLIFRCAIQQRIQVVGING
ncbi:unnamed protein product [Rotaria sordida]|uniref:Uncharacterized protein n=1 Tax=Rotaria sordida TaxID=392033 RepID=A0A814PKK1_9BILA|nr:unnamed protein product [Rotaria sordida]CAF1107260.1 unnamed protein product [Rotaria sordida]CAF1316604.1 unnamed protein product [Rotaria sordida]CAF3716789.1 unnamed protein product [Rotaria sordida]